MPPLMPPLMPPADAAGDAADLFGAVSVAYGRHRPTYPEAFFEAFAAHLKPASGAAPLVWDCGCGSGQASRALARRGIRVIATDASAAQLAEADPHPLISYRQAPASASGLDDAGVDGVLVAAAVHWFAGDAFNAEVRRVCRPGAVMAWIGYLPFQVDDGSAPPGRATAMDPLQRALDHFYGETLRPWWPPQRHWVDKSYAGLPFPGQEWDFPTDLWIERRWDLQQLLGYLGTWSAVQAARQAGHDPLPQLAAALAQLWPEAGAMALLVRWPFMGRWGVVR
jgi:SAM-dependent methyltransferase